MATADDYASWIVKNADKKGTPEFATVAAAYQQAKGDSAPPQSEQVSAGQAALISGGAYFDRLAAGLKQLVPAPAANALDKVGSALGMADSSNLEQSQSDNAKMMYGIQQQHPIASAVGELPLAMVAKSPLGMAAMGGLEYGSAGERAARAAGGFVGGKAGELVGKGLARVAQPIRGAVDEFTGATKALFDKYGINPLPSQTTGSKPLGWLESTVANLPGGSSVRDAVSAQERGLGRAAMSAAGGTGDLVTPEAVNAARTATGSAIGRATAPETVAIDQTVAGKLTGVENDYYKNLSPDQRSIVKTYIDDILSYGENGMPGDVYQKARSRIAARASSTQDSELKNALTGVYKALDRAFDASAGSDAAATVAQLRGQYRVAKTLDPLANVTGDLSPARIANAAKNLPGAGGDLADLGARMKSLPNSGTMQRLMYQGILSGGVGAGTQLATGNPMDAAKYGAGTFAAPYLASKMLTSGAFQKYLEKGLLKLSPEAERKLIESLGFSGGLLGINTGGQFGQRFSP